MLQDDRAVTVPEPSVWAGWPLAAAEAWTQALLAFQRQRAAASISPMLQLVLWHDWRMRGALPELQSWVTLAADFERHGVTADAFVRFYEAAGVPRWSPSGAAVVGGSPIGEPVGVPSPVSSPVPAAL